MHEEQVSVSVIIPCYNSAGTIRRAVKSVINQSKIPLEIILVDDASSDNGLTLKAFHEIKENYNGPIKFITAILDKNVGVGSARNVGWNLAVGEYVAFLDSDDVWHEEKLNIQYTIMTSNEDAGFSAHSWSMLKKNTFEEEPIELRVTEISKRRELFKHSIWTSTVMIKRELPVRFLDGKRYSEDFLLWIQALDFGGLYIDCVLASMLKRAYGESGLSSALYRMEKGELMTLVSLYRGKNICGCECMLAIFFSMIKFIVRVVGLLFRVR